MDLGYSVPRSNCDNDLSSGSNSISNDPTDLLFVTNQADADIFHGFGLNRSYCFSEG